MDFKFASCNSSSTFLVQQIVVIDTSRVVRGAPEGSSMEKLAKGSVPIVGGGKGVSKLFLENA